MIDSIVARRVQLVGFRLDGVLTDGAYHLALVGGQVAESRRFETADDLGVQLLRAAAIRVVLLTERPSEATTRHAEVLGVDDVRQDGRGRLLPAFEAALRRFTLRMEDAAFLGADFPDVPILRRVGLPIVVANATPEARAAAREITNAEGGRGAVREVAESLLRARGEWDDLVQGYLVEHGEPAARVSRSVRGPVLR